MARTIEEIRQSLRDRNRRKQIQANRVARKSAPTSTPQARRDARLAGAARQAGLGTSPEILNMLKSLERATSGFARRLDAVERTGNRIQRVERGVHVSRRNSVIVPRERSAIRQRSVSLPGIESNIDTFRGEKRKFMLTRAIRYILTGRENGCEYEASVFAETEKQRDNLVTKTPLSAGTDSLGGFLIPTQIMDELVELIRAQVVLADAGATFLTGLVGAPVIINKQATAGTGYWVAENTAPTESNQTFGQLSLTPHTAAALVKLSKRFVNMATPAAEALVREDLSLQVALLIDLAGLRGNGASGSPIGIANWPGILTVSAGTNGGPMTYDLLVNMVAKVRENNGLKNAKSPAWIMATPLIGVLQRLKDADGRPLLLSKQDSAGDMGDDAVGRLLGYPVYHTTQIPTDLTSGTGTGLTECYFGDIGSLLIGQWGGVEIAASDETSDAFTKRQVHLILHQDLDFGIRQEQRLCLCNDVSAT